MDIHYFCQSQDVERDQINSEAEAIALKQARWKVAQALGIYDKIAYVAEWLGHNENGFLVVRITELGHITQNISDEVVKVSWKSETESLQVHVRRRCVYCNYETFRFIIPGEWLQLVLNLLPQVESAAGISEVSSKASALRKALGQL